MKLPLCLLSAFALLLAAGLAVHIANAGTDIALGVGYLIGCTTTLAMASWPDGDDVDDYEDE